MSLIVSINTIRSEKMKISYSYLGQQFADPDPYLNDIKELVKVAISLGKAAH